MRTTKQLVAHLRMLAGWHREDKGKLMTIEAMEEAAARLEELDAEGWRSVHEDMPNPGAWCMVCSGNDKVTDEAWWTGQQWRVNRVGYVSGITHWRPRPAPPKQENHK